MKRLLLIYNSNAGRQKVKTMLPEILDVFAQAGWITTVIPTRTRGDAAHGARALAASFDRVVCCGGDGTLNETVNGLMGVPERLRPALGYIPTGTTNDFSRNLSLPRGTEKLAQTACGDGVQPVDLGQAGERWFTYVAAFGLFTDVSYTTPQNAKNLLGHTAYVIEAAGRLTDIHSCHVKVEGGGRVVEDDFIYGMVGNTVSVGGLLNLPKSLVKLDDGLFEVLLVRTPRNHLDYQAAIHALMTQEIPQENGDGLVVGLQAGEVSFTCDHPLPWTLDGEFGGEHTVLPIKNSRQALQFACGK